MDDQNQTTAQSDSQADNSNQPASDAAETTPASENPFAALKENDPEAKEAEESNSTGEQAQSETNDKKEAGDGTIEEEAAPSEELTDQSPEEPAAEDAQSEEPSVPANPNARWYVVHTFAGHENKVAAALKQRIEAEHLENLIFDILVPTQDKIEIRGGKKETVKEKIFPGYILIKMELNDNSWLAVRTTQGVTSFIGAGNKPTPISEAEVATIVKFTSQGAQPTFKDVFMVDDTVKIIDGPFAEFIGKVDSVDKEKGRVRVLVSIFGRETPVELDFLQVQKL
jgi:transcription termination/antitermination protein NusG